MYSSMITPVCTETPKRARNPTPLDTLKCVPVRSSASRPPRGAMATLARIRQRPFRGLKHGVENNENQEQSDRQHEHQPFRRPFLAFVFAGPVQVISGGQLHLLALTFFMASSTVLPRSRPRTLYLIAT